MKIVAIIPARSGSKRLPGKNIALIGGKPLIQHSIDTALKSKYINRVVVSTDSQEIADISKSAGAEIPYIRPSELALDTSTSIDVLLHMLTFLGPENYFASILLQPTSPLRLPVDIDNSIELFLEKNASSVTSVTTCDHSPLLANTLPATMSMEHFLLEKIGIQRGQDLPVYYRLNGAIYINKISKLIEEKRIISKNNCYAFVMPKERSIDIDDSFDFQMADFLFSQRERP